jgi:hypothetical protein
MKSNDISEKHVTFTFRDEEQVKAESSIKQASSSACFILALGFTYSSALQSVTSQTTELFITNVVRTSNPTPFKLVTFQPKYAR